jgi:hypothetical protein
MGKSETQRDPIPDSSATLNELIEFWDSHSTADYEDETDEVNFVIDLQEEGYTVALVPELVNRLEHQARARGVTTETLVNVWLAERLMATA